MAFSIPLRGLHSKDKSLIRRDFTVKKNKSQFAQDPEPRECFDVDRSLGKVYLPLGKWNDHYEEFPHNRQNYPSTQVQFQGKLYSIRTDPRGIRDQNVLVREAIAQLRQSHTCFIAAHTGYGKTRVSIYLLAWSRMKAVVLVFSDILQRQWKKEIEKITTAKVQLVKNSTADLDPTADIYVIGVKRASMMDRRKFTGIGMVILDEAHVATETSFCQTLLKFESYYLIGATATPSRPDGLHKIFYLYFGSGKDFIVREERDKRFRVIKYQTPFKPTVEYRTVYGKLVLDWSKVQTSIASIPERQAEIVNIILRNPEEKIMVLSARKDQSKAIHRLLLEKGEDVELLIGTKKVWDRDKRILVAGMKKAGVGFDDPKLTMLILASDVKDVRQYEGRLRTDNCLIYDIVDNFSTFKTHWELREQWYLRKGGTIEFEGSDPHEKVQPPRRFLPPLSEDPSED